MRVYTWLGVASFQKLVLALEKKRHQKDGGYNVNYHVENFSLRGLHAFMGYLVYHAVIHTVGILIALLCCGLPLLFPHTGWAAVVGALCCIGNVYCLLLQRYTYIKLKAHIRKRESRQAVVTARKQADIHTALKTKNRDETVEEYRVLCDIQWCIAAGKPYVLTAQNAATVPRMATVLQATPHKRRAVATQGSLDDLFAALPKSKTVVPAAKRHAAALQNLCGVPKKHNLLYAFCVVPDSEESAKALLSCNATDETALFGLLFEAYQSFLGCAHG